MRLLEREPSLASLATCAQEARHGEGRLVLVAGEAGVGKSALVEQLQNDLADARWSWGACDGLFTPRPLGPLFDLAAQLGGELEQLCRASAPREDLFRALLRQVSEPGALDVVVVEDVHWADEATVDLLRFLGRRLRDAPVLLVATYRDEDLAAGDPLRIALGDLATQRTTRRVWLTPLSAAAVQILAEGSGLETAELYRLTGGNPFYVTEVVQAGLGAVPASARDAVLARAARLDGASREVLDTAALIGARVEPDLLTSVTSCPPPVLDELLASGLLAGEGDRLRFRHEIARLAVEQAVAPHHRAAIHARILGVLGSLGLDDDARMAFHAEAAGDGTAVLHHAPLAARQAAGLGSHREAAAQFERALRFAAGADPAMAAGLYDGLAYELMLLHRNQDAVDASEHALALWRQVGNRLREGETLRGMSCVLDPMGRGSEANAVAEAAVGILEPLGPSIELARAYSSLAAMRMVHSRHQAAIDLAVRAQAAAEPLGALDVLSDALNTQGCAVCGMGGEWTGYLRRALEIALAAGVDEQAGRAFSNLCSCYVDQRRFAEAEQYFADGIAYCDERDVRSHAAYLRGERVNALNRTGRWDEATELGTELLVSTDPSSAYRNRALEVLGLIRARRGEPGAWEYLDQVAAAADTTGEPQWIIPARLARAEAHWLEGEPHLARLEAELADDVSTGFDAWERGELTAWLRRTGSDRQPHGELAGPYLHQAEGDWEEAARLWLGLGCPYEAALALYDSGQEAALRQALTIFTDLGAPAAAQLTRHAMRRLGIRSIPAGPRTATRADPLGLTRREREVLELICAGHTNAEIAAKLFISPKTVDHHVSAVLAKLDAPTREVAATHAARLGLVTARELPARRGDASGVPRPRHLLTAVVIARPGGDGRHTRQQRVTAL
jgi:DNA-binding CsgD family transcriptional regulator/tetratricopeptide (TPR) repeat protein